MISCKLSPSGGVVSRHERVYSGSATHWQCTQGV